MTDKERSRLVACRNTIGHRSQCRSCMTDTHSRLCNNRLRNNRRTQRNRSNNWCRRRAACNHQNHQSEDCLLRTDKCNRKGHQHNWRIRTAICTCFHNNDLQHRTDHNSDLYKTRGPRICRSQGRSCRCIRCRNFGQNHTSSSSDRWGYKSAPRICLSQGRSCRCTRCRNSRQNHTSSSSDLHKTNCQGPAKCMRSLMLTKKIHPYTTDMSDVLQCRLVRRHNYRRPDHHTCPRN